LLKLRKIELLGFKSFCEKTQVTFGGGGITCIVGPNGCGKSNIVDAISWVLGEQSHKMLRAERMSDCIFNGTAKRPPLGLAEVSLTLVDADLAAAAAKILNATDEEAEGSQATAIVDGQTPDPGMMAEGRALGSAVEDDASASAAEEFNANPVVGRRGGPKRAAEPATKPGEVVIGRRLYRSGQSEYILNGRIARLRDIQELFMGMGLGPDSYAIIEQGRIGQILNSRPMDRRAIIEEAAGVTAYKSKRRLAEAKLEASKLNLSRVNDILVEIEKQLGSLKRQASKARRFAEVRDEMRGLVRKVLGSKALQLEAEGERLRNLVVEITGRESERASDLERLELEHERLNARSYELDGELKHVQNALNLTSLELDRAQNRMEFNRSQRATVDARIAGLAGQSEAVGSESAGLEAQARVHAQAEERLVAEVAAIESSLVGLNGELAAAAEGESGLEKKLGELRNLLEDLVTEKARNHVLDEERTRKISEYIGLKEKSRRKLDEASSARDGQVVAFRMADEHQTAAQASTLRLSQALRDGQTRQMELRRAQQEATKRLQRSREGLTLMRARSQSIAQILDERAYTAEAVQKLFAANGNGEVRGFHAVGLLADYAEVRQEYESAVEQFLRDELEYVVVETFDHARSGIALLREEMGGRATFFVDSLRALKLDADEPEPASPVGVIARMDRLVEFRDPLGPAAKHFLPRLRAAFMAEAAPAAERLARENVSNYYLTPDGTCYHGRMVTGGRVNEAGPLALKRELRQFEAEAVRMETEVNAGQVETERLEEELSLLGREIESLAAEHLEAEKAAVGAAHLCEEERRELERQEHEIAEWQAQADSQAAEEARLAGELESSHERFAEATRRREEAEAVIETARQDMVVLRQGVQARQEESSARKAEMAAAVERLAGAKQASSRVRADLQKSAERLEALRREIAGAEAERGALEANSVETGRRAEELAADKGRLDERRRVLDEEWSGARNSFATREESLKESRRWLEELRAERSQKEVDQARNDSDREHLRQTCMTEVNQQPEELMAEEPNPLTGEELEASEGRFAELKARLEAMGPVNMMALEEFRECEERNAFLTRERDDLVESTGNTRQGIAELDTISREKFEHAFLEINAHFAAAFRTLFGGGTGEMRLTELDSSGECGIEIVAQPPGKRLQNILLLSGGEKALTALGLLIAVFRYQPSPFCILDEVDAPLDESNVGRFNVMLKQMGSSTQCIVVTHNRKTMEMGSVMYGVTMQEPGVSKLVSVRWDEEVAEQEASAA
jgi:chromosome segregation protein